MGRIARAASGTCQALTPIRITSAFATCVGSSVAWERTTISPAGVSRRRPLLRIALRCSPRAIKTTSSPASANCAPKYPPAPPVPKTATHCSSSAPTHVPGSRIGRGKSVGDSGYLSPLYAHSPERWKTLVLGSVADGILDAALLLVYEKRFRPEEKWHAPWQQRQQAKIDRALDQLEKSPPAWSGSPDYGHLTLACALGYLDFRHEGRWRAGHPKLVAWLGKNAKAVPAFEETRPTV